MTKFSKKIELFRHQAEKLKKYSGELMVNSKLSFSWSDQDKVAKVSSQGPDEKTIISIFVAFRPFIMKNRINFEQMCKDVIDTVDDLNIKKDTENVLSAWHTALDRPEGKTQNKILLKIGNKKINREQNLNYWMNEEHFHPENYKLDGSRGLSLIKKQPLFKGLSKMQMIDLLQKLTIFILWFDQRVLDKIQND